MVAVSMVIVLPYDYEVTTIPNPAFLPGLEVWYPGLAWDQSLGFVEEDLDTTNTGLGPTACLGERDVAFRCNHKART